MALRLFSKSSSTLNAIVRNAVVFGLKSVQAIKNIKGPFTLRLVMHNQHSKGNSMIKSSQKSPSRSFIVFIVDNLFAVQKFEGV